MKKLFSLVIASILILLTGCTNLSPSVHGELAGTDGIVMTTQFPVYDKSIQEIQVVIENSSASTAEFGSQWSLEVRQGDTWMEIPFIPDMSWTMPLYLLNPNGTWTFTVHTSALDYTLKDGEYRVVKKIGDTVYAAPFKIGESMITAQSPYGYAPLDTLPKDYTWEAAAADGVIVYHLDGTVDNAKRVEIFFKEYQIGMDTQLRFASFTDEGHIVLTDLFAENISGGYRIRWTQDSTRGLNYDSSQTKETYYSRLVTDGKSFFLSNHTFYTDNALLLYELSAASLGNPQWTQKIEQSMAASHIRLAVWSPDGSRSLSVSAAYPLEFYTNIYSDEGSSGYTSTLSVDGPITAIREIVWENNSKAMFVCDTAQDGVIYYAFYDTDAETVTSYTSSFYDYFIDSDGHIQIPE